MNNDYFILLENPIDEDLNRSSIKILDKSNKNGKTIIEAILQDVDNKNRNGRIYARDRMSQMIRSPRFLEQLHYRGLKGEAGHPSSTETGRQATVDPKLVSHRILDLWMEGSYIKGKVMASGPYGKYFEEDIQEGEYPAFSFRGIGHLQTINGQPHAIVTTPITWDRVYYPSHKVAYMIKTLNESSNNDIDDINDNELVMTESKAIVITNNQSVEKFIKDESKRLKRLSECFNNHEIKSVEYNKRSNMVKLNMNEKQLLFPLEEYVTNQIINYV